MGAYLSEPVTEKISSDASGKYVKYGASSMQGWRITQEDAHNCILEFDTDTSLFAVYDGHGGHEVAAYAAEFYPEALKKSASYKSNKLEQALVESFKDFDRHLASEEGLSNLEMLSRDKISDDQDGRKSPESETADSIHALCQEAQMPLEEVMAKYHGEPKFAHKCRNLEGVKVPVSYANVQKNCASGSGTKSSAGVVDTDAGSSSASTSQSSQMAEEKTEAQESVPDDQNLAKADKSECPSDISVNDLKKLGKKCVHENREVKQSGQGGDQLECEERVVENGGMDSETVSENGDASPSEKKRACGVLMSKRPGQSNKTSNSESEQCADGVERQSPEKQSSKQALKEVYRDLLVDSIDTDDDDEDDDGDETFPTPENSEEEEDATVEEDDAGEEGYEEDDSSMDGEDDEEEEEEEEEEEPSSPSLEIVIPGMDSGCTAVVALLRGRDLYVANAGDSRCVLCHNGKALDMSIDHKPEDEEEMKRIVSAGGKVTPDGRVNGGLNLSRAFGDHAYKQTITLGPEKQMIIAKPDVQTCVVHPSANDFMILACDGIWNYMSSQQVVDFVRERLPHTEQLSSICEELFDHCLAPNTMGDGTGCDNMTAVIVKFLPAIADAVQTLPISVCVQKATKRVASSPDSSTEDDVKRAKTD